jgi:RNA polymerase sigma-70 factor (ECF subfamily)
VAWSKPQDRRTNGIQPAVAPLLAARRRATDRAFERLYRKHVHAVYRYALAVLHNEADAEDVTQTTFLNAYGAFQRGERPHTPHNWLIKIAHNVCRQRFRDSSRRPREVEFDDSLVATPTDDVDVPTATEIGRALGYLALNQRAALVMRELEGRSYAEIAQVLDLTVGAVETLIFRARRALREQLEGGLTCHEAEQTLASLQKRRISNAERRVLRAHLRECKDCATLERRQRAQRAALEHLGAVPLPASLASFFGSGATGGAAAGGVGLGAKIATMLAAGLVVTSAGHEPVKARATDESSPKAPRAATRPQPSSAAAATQTARRPHHSATSTRQVRKLAPKRSRPRTETRAPAPVKPKPLPVEPSPSEANGGAQQPAGGPPSVRVRVRVQTPGVQLPELDVQVPQLPPPLRLPPPPVPLPPLPLPLPPPPLR